AFPVEHIYEPEPGELFSRLLPRFIEVMIHRALLEHTAGEHGARMTAMDNATKNAEELIEKLTLLYNKARQASITKEVTEISSTAEALKAQRA
ncbi:MAG: F0F1 ATP synthase subunit gamma, partial [Deltaproteobacteria bacterium]